LYLALGNPMTSAFGRGSAPDRARSADDRPGSFKKGHKKIGGRKKGTPNRVSPNLKRVILEAAYRVGCDGTGKDGVRGYFAWVAVQHTHVFVVELLSRCLEIESTPPYQRQLSREEVDKGIQDFIRANPTTPQRPSSEPSVTTTLRAPLNRALGDYNDQVNVYMEMAMTAPKAFCKILGGALPVLPRKSSRCLASATYR
jgi:hypothetical protein